MGYKVGDKIAVKDLFETGLYVGTIYKANKTTLGNNAYWLRVDASCTFLAVEGSDEIYPVRKMKGLSCL